MGCGKSKHDVASGNTVLKRKESSVKHNKDQEIGAQTKDDDNSNVNVNVNVNSGVGVQKDGDNVVKEVVGGKVDDVDSNVVKSETENASVPEETVLRKSNDIVAGEDANVGREEKVLLEKSEEVVSGGDEVEGSNSENANEGEEKVVEKSEEVVVADEVEIKTEKADVGEEVKEEEKKNKEVDGEEGLVPREASEKSLGEEEDALKLNENDQKVNDAVVAEEKKTVDGKGMSTWGSVGCCDKQI